MCVKFVDIANAGADGVHMPVRSNSSSSSKHPEMSQPPPGHEPSLISPSALAVSLCASLALAHLLLWCSLIHGFAAFFWTNQTAEGRLLSGLQHPGLALSWNFLESSECLAIKFC